MTQMFVRSWMRGLLAAVTITGCAAEDEGQVVEDPFAAGLLPSDWLGLQLGVAPPTFVDQGKVEVVESEEALHRKAEPVPANTSFEHGDPNAYDVTDLKTGHHYSVTLPADIAQVAAAQAQRQRASMPAGQSARASLIDKVISGGADGRARAAIDDGYATAGYYAAIGELRFGECSGVLISDRAYLTAAHCVVTAQRELLKRDFFPRRDPGLLPWGEWTATHVSVPQAFINNRCYQRTDPYEMECAQYDIALVRIAPDPAFSTGHEWFFLPVVETREQLDTRRLRNYGYPSCRRPEAPLNCESGALYGDRADCELGADSYAVPGALFAPVAWHSCDTSVGHSGGPVFYWDDDGKPLLVGLHIGGRRRTSLATPNWIKRFSPNTLNWIQGLL